MVNTSVEQPEIRSVPSSLYATRTLRLDAGFLLGATAGAAVVGAHYAAFKGSIFKRTYVEDGIPFFQPSQIQDLDPAPAQHISVAQQQAVSVLKVEKRQILLTRSGTIGDVALVGRTMSGKVFSDDLIRIVEKSDALPIEYLYAYLKSDTGRSLLVGNNYGSVIQHIEPDQLLELDLPAASSATVLAISQSVSRAQCHLDVSNDLMRIARGRLMAALAFPKKWNLPVLAADTGVECRSIRISEMGQRLDGSFYDAESAAIEHYLIKAGGGVKLGDPGLTSRFCEPTRFKRIFVDAGNGFPYIGGKELPQNDPRSGKWLSRSIHAKAAGDLFFKKNQIAISCSGTIGKINIVPGHWCDFVSSPDMIRLEATSDILAGYLFAWLTTPPGQKLLEKQIYGSTIGHVEVEHVAEVIVPVLNTNSMELIGRLVLRANKHREQAFILEQGAVQQFNKDVLGIT